MIRVDLPRPQMSGPPPLPTGEKYVEMKHISAVLMDCPKCDRVHYAALECPPADAETFVTYHRGKAYTAVIEAGPKFV